LRPIQRSFSLGCQAKITLSYNKALNCLVVRECNLDHNHHTGEEIYRHYPSARKLSKDEEKNVTDVLGLKANSKHVRDLIARRYGKFVTLKDIQNLKTKGEGKVSPEYIWLPGCATSTLKDSNL